MTLFKLSYMKASCLGKNVSECLWMYFFKVICKLFEFSTILKKSRKKVPHL